MTHPGDASSVVPVHQEGKPVLPLGGRRSILGAWPVGATCEQCNRAVSQGYIGPVQGWVVSFPAPETRFVCEPCARAMLDLDPGELEGHVCDPKYCTDYLHREVMLFNRGELDNLEPDGRRAKVQQTLDSLGNGWDAFDVREAPDAPVVTGRFWAVWMQSHAALPWEESEEL